MSLCQESLGANPVDVAANAASFWLPEASLQLRQKTVTEITQSACQMCEFTSLILSASAEQ